MVRVFAFICGLIGSALLGSLLGYAIVPQTKAENAGAAAFGLLFICWWVLKRPLTR